MDKNNSVTRQLVTTEAKRRGWTVRDFGLDGFFYRITDDTGHSEIFRGSRPMQTSSNGARIARYKNMTLDFVESIGYKTPAHMLLGTIAEAEKFMLQYGDIVVKPVDAERSQGVTVGVRNKTGLRKAIKLAKEHSTSGDVILQKQLSGELYRLMVIDGQFVGATHRRAPQVIGDGASTVRSLIQTINQDPRRDANKMAILKPISMEAAVEFLGDKGLAAIPAAGEAVIVCSGNSAGGESLNVTNLLHPSWKQAAVDIAGQAGVFTCGFDIMAEDITIPYGDELPILEMNSMPAIKLLHYPTGGGEPIDAASILLDAVFKGSQTTKSKINKQADKKGARI